MSAIKNALMEILECKVCDGFGFIPVADGHHDYRWEVCKCNPHELDVTEMMN